MTDKEFTPQLGLPLPDSVRLWLALSILGLLIVDIGVLLLLVGLARLSPNDLPGVATALLSPVVGLAGTAIGFYFGSKTDAD